MAFSALSRLECARCRSEGMFMCPEGAATLSATRALTARGGITETDEVVLLNTGSGVVYPAAVKVDVPAMASDDVRWL